jgi:RND family efflux transporter MFP subunit
MNRHSRWVSALLWLLAGCLANAHADQAASPSVLVETRPVVQQDVSDTLAAFGVLDPEPDRVLSLSLPHAGLINRVWVRLGQRVRSGDKLLEVETAPDARMQYLQAQSAVNYAGREVERQQRLLGEQLATKAQLDAAKKSLKDAQTRLDALRKQGMDSARDTLRSPVDGIVTRLDVSQGERAQAETTALLIASERHLVARLGVEPEDLKVLHPGIPVTLTSVFVPSVAVNSTVKEVHAMVDPKTHLVEVLVPVPEQQAGQLVLGSRVLGKFQLASHPALVVPYSAVLGDASGAYLFGVKGGVARRIDVKTGIETDGGIEVSGPLKAGDQVVVSGNYELADGMAVRAQP